MHLRVAGANWLESFDRRIGTDVPDRINVMKRLLVPWALGVSAARHLAWYVSYQVTGEPRSRG